jgi:hypothetical protein
MHVQRKISNAIVSLGLNAANILRLTGKYIWHKMCISFISIALVRNSYPSDKYLGDYAKYTEKLVYLHKSVNYFDPILTTIRIHL